MTFVQSGEVIAGADGVTHTGVTCFRCGQKDITLTSAPAVPTPPSSKLKLLTLLQASYTEVIVADDNNANHAVSDFTFIQLPSRHELIPSSWVLLDSQSTVSVFKTRISSLTSGSATIS